MALITVVVPVFNIQEFLPTCVRSILAQTHRDLELILVDDGSEDASSRICDIFSSVDPRVRVHHQENRGASAARNMGIELAKGDFITFIDGDDLINPQMIERLLNAFNQHPSTDIAVCEKFSFEKEPEFETISGSASTKLYDGHEALIELLHQKIFNGPVGKLFRRDIFETIRFPQGVKIGEDLLMNMEAFKAASWVSCLPYALYAYRNRPGSAINSGSFVDRMRLITLMEQELERNLACSQVKTAISSRIFSETTYASTHFPLSLKPNRSKEWRDTKILLRKYKGTVVKNKGALPLYRIFSLLCYISPSMPRLLFSLRRLQKIFTNP